MNQATDRLSGRRTTLVVAHRLTTAARADRIVVLDHGRIAEDGTHGELLARGGKYARLWHTFAGGTGTGGATGASTNGSAGPPGLRKDGVRSSKV